jgi:hypothetical protein
MNISILGYNFNLEVLILIGVVYLILVGHTFCGCAKFSLTEGLETLVNNNENDSYESDSLPTQTTSDGNLPAPVHSISSSSVTTTTGNKNKGKEGFTGANINFGESSRYDLRNNTPIDTSSWNAQNLVVVPGQEYSQGVKDFIARPQQQLPLPEGEMDFFANTKFAPEYCPNTYSNSMGCAAMTGPQYNYLITRGGNNVPFSEF